MKADTKGWWTVKLHVFAFDTKDEACDFRDMLEDMVEDMPEFGDLGVLTRVEFESDDPRRGTTTRLEAVQALREAVARGKTVKPNRPRPGMWHFGDCELRAFFDAVWGPAKGKDEEVSIKDLEALP